PAPMNPQGNRMNAVKVELDGMTSKSHCLAIGRQARSHRIGEIRQFLSVLYMGISEVDLHVGTVGSNGNKAGLPDQVDAAFFGNRRLCRDRVLPPEQRQGSSGQTTTCQP